MGLSDGMAWEREHGAPERPIVAAQPCGDPIWKTMDSAPTDLGIEVIAARFVR